MAIYSKSKTSVEGLDDIVKGFKKVMEKGRPYVKDATEKNAKEIKTGALRNLERNKSIKTGALWASMNVKESKGKSITGGTVIFTVGPRYTSNKSKGTGVNYGHLVELGHKTKSGKQVPAKPYLRPAADDNKEEFIRDVAEAMNAAVEQFGK